MAYRDCTSAGAEAEIRIHLWRRRSLSRSFRESCQPTHARMYRYIAASCPAIKISTLIVFPAIIVLRKNFSETYKQRLRLKNANESLVVPVAVNMIFISLWNPYFWLYYFSYSVSCPLISKLILFRQGCRVFYIILYSAMGRPTVYKIGENNWIQRRFAKYRDYTLIFYECIHFVLKRRNKSTILSRQLFDVLQNHDWFDGDFLFSRVQQASKIG